VYFTASSLINLTKTKCLYAHRLCFLVPRHNFGTAAFTAYTFSLLTQHYIHITGTYIIIRQACIPIFKPHLTHCVCLTASPAVLAAQPLTQQRLPGSVASGPIPVKAQWQLDQQEGEKPAAAATAAAAAAAAVTGICSSSTVNTTGSPKARDWLR
jgi:hypothetical protein